MRKESDGCCHVFDGVERPNYSAAITSVLHGETFEAWQSTAHESRLIDSKEPEVCLQLAYLVSYRKWYVPESFSLQYLMHIEIRFYV